VGVKKAAGGETETNGWGLTLTGRLSTIGRDSLGFGGTVGDGIGSYAAGMATSPAAAGPTLAGGLKAKRVLGGYGGPCGYGVRSSGQPCLMAVFG
jgi:hypothetical protein